MTFPHRFAFLTALVLAPLTAACSGAGPDPVVAAPDASADASPAPTSPLDPPPPPPPGDASADANDAAPDSGKPSCNALVNLASDVPIIAEPSQPPASTGGVIADGTYVVTNAVLYTGSGGAAGPTGKSVKMTVQFAGGISESVFDGVTRSATIAFEGTMIHSTTTCPGKGTDDVSYSATPTSISIVLIDSAGARVYFLEKQ